ncbi:fibrillin-1-like [Hyposmocoma kahamanoa]|uniref:fibrillin-1-like n=1 Tax=Hyposmocoma kahamanoa TaxID=1477025 RepID=UPI000E6D6C6A|nr:fibrillin-1-like [Hyposmocoma kahamanoa]
MWYWKGIILACFLHSCLGLRTCLQDAECSSLEGSICLNGTCACPPGYQSALGGTRCLSLAPYHTSVCVETYQCSRLFSSFECLKAENATEGTCRCQPGHHYFLGSCWPTTDFGEPCFRDEQCLSTIRDPYSMSCNGTCQCAEGYDLRQRGECRKIGRAVGDGCVLDVDCHFEGGACDRFDFICYNTNDATRTIPLKSTAAVNTTVTKSITTRNNTLYESCPCSHPFVCYLDTCVCPLGYYSNADGNSCLPELGSPGTNSTCTGLLAVVIDGICTCRPNFFFQENMRDCVRVSRTLSDSCVEDLNCHSFGAAARCGPPQQWGIRNCECDTEQAIWDAQRQMCRLFSGVGEFCEQDSDCLAGELEIQCVVTDGQGVCTCPDWLTEMDGLCLNIGLGALYPPSSSSHLSIVLFSGSSLCYLFLKFRIVLEFSLPSIFSHLFGLSLFPNMGIFNAGF